MNEGAFMKWYVETQIVAATLAKLLLFSALKPEKYSLPTTPQTLLLEDPIIPRLGQTQE